MFGLSLRLTDQGMMWAPSTSEKQLLSLVTARVAGGRLGEATLLDERGRMPRIWTPRKKRGVTNTRNRPRGEATTNERPVPNPAQQLADVTQRLRNAWIDRQLTALTHRASQPETSDAENEELLRLQFQLRQRKHHRLPLPDSSG